MNWIIEIKPYRLIFKEPAGTSRGIYLTRDVHYLYLSSPDFPGRIGVGECAPLPNLSCDDISNYEEVLQNICKEIETTGCFNPDLYRNYPSILFGLEMAFQHWKRNSYQLWDTAFSRGEEGIPINGLIWMGSHDKMFHQIKEKLAKGFRCVKLKIGAIDFEEEFDLLTYIRSQFSAKDVELRVDANGAFGLTDALEKLNRLATLDIHSIEQPICAGHWNEMARLVRQSPLPIALDEELIGVNALEDKRLLLDTISPAYIILKPSLHGGMLGCKEWIDEAEKRGIRWWITSALESNIGLNAIAQWSATFSNPLPQGLGTGALFTNNLDMPLQVIGDQLYYRI